MQTVVNEDIRKAIRAAIAASGLSTRAWGLQYGLPACVVSRWLNDSGTAIRQGNWGKLYPAIVAFLPKDAVQPIVAPITPDQIEAKMDALLCEIVHQLNAKQKVAALDALRDISAHPIK